MAQRFILIALAGASLAGCSSVKDSLGMSAANVDAYMIEPHDLTLPPDYKARPPRSGDNTTPATSKPADTAVEDVLKKS